MKYKYLIKELRFAKRLTQEQLANLAGVSKQTISDAEKGGLNLSYRLIRQIAQALQVEPWEVLIDKKVVLLSKENTRILSYSIEGSLLAIKNEDLLNYYTKSVKNINKLAVLIIAIYKYNLEKEEKLGKNPLFKALESIK